MSDLPEPLTPTGCNLQDFPFMPLDVVRLRDSDLSIHATGEEFRCAVLLWCASWHQVPAASLPDDDKTLASLAGFGRAVSEWVKHREGALRGWIKCSDGRLYHPVVAEKAVDALKAKLEQRWKTECARVKKHNQRHDTDHLVHDFETWLSLGCPQGQTLSVLGTKANDHGDTPVNGQGQDGNVPANYQKCPGSVPGEMPSKGQGEGQGQGYIKDKAAAANTSTTVDAVDNSPPLPPVAEEPDKPGGTPPLDMRTRYAVLIRGWEKDRGKACRLTSSDPRLTVWAEKGVTEVQLREAYELAVADRDACGDVTAVSAGFVDVFLTKVLNPPAGKSGLSRASAPAAARHWTETWSGIVAFGAEHGIEQQEGEADPAFKARVFAAANLSEHEKSVLRADYGVRI